VNLYSIFYGPEGRLRSGWRFGVFACAFTALWIVLAGIGNTVMLALRITTPSTVFILNSIFGLALALLVGWLAGYYLDGVPFKALGAWFTPGWMRHFVFGLAVGAASITLAVAIASAMGDLNIAWNTASSINEVSQTLLISFIVFSTAAAFEEVLFRGYLLQTFARSGLAWVAILLTSIFFGAVHLGNPNAGYISSINTALAGVWFGIAYLKTRDLWFVWAMHLMWNWMQGSIFGIEVSGLRELVPAPLMREVDGGPTWLTGGEYGIEGGIACTAALILSTLAIYLLPFLRASEEILRLQKPLR